MWHGWPLPDTSHRIPPGHMLTSGIQIHLLTYVRYFEKIKGGLCSQHDASVCVSPLNFYCLTAELLLALGSSNSRLPVPLNSWSYFALWRPWEHSDRSPSHLVFSCCRVGRACKLLMTLASTVIPGSESGGIDDHISLCHDTGRLVKLLLGFASVVILGFRPRRTHNLFLSSLYVWMFISHIVVR
jgi:hypothetical protein